MRIQLLASMGLIAVGIALGQEVAQVSGSVMDPSGAVVPGVEITLTQTDTGVKRTATTDAAGLYIIPNLPLGPYRLEAVKMGFRTFVQTGIVLQVGSNPTIPITLAVGNVTEQVLVQADTSQVETRSAGVGTTVMQSQQILDLPLNGRQATDLIPLSGLAVQTGAAPTYTMYTGVNISVAGSTSWSVQYNLDGAPNVDAYVGTNMPIPFPDALQEFRLSTSAQDPATGGHSGASVDTVTKSGTNGFHGDVFEFFRNSSLNARDFFAAGSDGLKRNQFGGVLGGPIKKDKLFFFLGYQETMIRQNLVNSSAYVPTAPELTGNFSQYVAAGCPGAAGIAHSFLVANGHLVLPLSPAALKISSHLPQTTDPCGHVLYGIPLHQNQLQAPARIDYQLSSKQSLFARYMATRIETAQPYDISHNALSTNGIGQDDMAQQLALGDTYVASPTLINSFRLSGTRVGAGTLGAKTFTPQDVGMNFYSYYGFVPLFMVGAGFSTDFPANFSVGTDTVTSFGANDDVTLIRGSHQFSFGAQVSRSLLNAHSYAWSEGFFLFVGLTGLAGSPLVDFLTGNPLQVHQANPNPDNLAQNYFGLYASDTWKATSRLTLTYGVRWNPFLPAVFKNGDDYNFSLTNFYNNVRSKVIPAAPPGLLYPGDPGFNDKSGMNNQWNHIEPRIGIAWDPFGDGKTAIRAGGGIAYDYIRMDIHENTSSVAPFRITVVQNNPNPVVPGGLSLDNPYANFPGGNPFPYNFNPQVFPNLPYQGFLPIDPNLKTTAQYSWNFGIQRQITPRFFVSGTYVGTELAHLWTGVDLNPPIMLPGLPVIASASTPAQIAQCATLQANCSSNENQRRLLELANPSAGNIYGSITDLDSSGTQHYNGLLLNTRWRLADNVNLLANWTWSHCIGLPASNIANLEAVYPHQPYQTNGPQNRHLDMGDCNGNSLDIRHIVNVTAVVSTPRFSGTWARRLGTGWTLSTIVNWRSGPPLTTALGTDNALNGFNPAGANPVPQRANQILPDVNAVNQGQSCSPAPCVSYLNPGAVAFPAAGTYGNMGVGDIRGPSFWEWDQAISRQFPIHEMTRLEFRAEAFNVTNSVRLGPPVVTLGGTFGQITSDQPTTGSGLGGGGITSGTGARVIQFALKFVF